MAKFLHTCVRVKDPEASLKFYKEALGFKAARRNDFPEYKFTLSTCNSKMILITSWN